MDQITNMDDYSVSKASQQQEKAPCKYPLAVTVRVSDVKAELLEWLWAPYIPLGKVTLLIGDPDLGKSLLTTTIAAFVSTAREWPIGSPECKQGSVILLSAEDDVADTIRPRLEASQADLTQIHTLAMIVDYEKDLKRLQERSFSLTKDISALDDVLSRSKNCRLVVIDPLSAYLQGVDSHRNSDVRTILAPLAKLAQEHHLAILGVTHLNKSGGPAAYRANGSIAFTAAARAVYAIGRDPNDPERRLVAPVKANLVAEAHGFAYRLQTVDTNVGAQPVIEFDPTPVDATADDILSFSTGNPKHEPELEKAVNWLKHFLILGPQSVNHIQEAAIDYGYSWATTRRAQIQLGIKPSKTGFNGGWVWELPQRCSI